MMLKKFTKASFFLMPLLYVDESEADLFTFGHILNYGLNK